MYLYERCHTKGKKEKYLYINFGKKVYYIDFQKKNIKICLKG